MTFQFLPLWIKAKEHYSKTLNLIVVTKQWFHIHTELYRIKTKSTGTFINSILYLAKSSFPSDIRVCWSNCRVCFYILGPRRGFKCQWFGRTEINCRSPNYKFQLHIYRAPWITIKPCFVFSKCRGPLLVFSPKCFYYNFEKEKLNLQARAGLFNAKAMRTVKESLQWQGIAYVSITSRHSLNIIPETTIISAS